MVDVKVTGAREAAAAIERFAADAERLESLADGGEQVERALAAESPRLTGRLAGSWQVARVSDGVEVGSDLIYASVQNYGSAHVTGLRYVEAAVAATEADVLRLVEQELDGLAART